MKKTIVTLLLAGLYSVSFSQNLKWALQDVKGGDSFHNGIASFYEKGLYGAIDCTGKVVIEPQFKSSFAFEDGSAVVRTPQNNYGIINREGLYLLPADYRDIEKCNEAEGMYIVKDSLGMKGLFYNNRMVIPIAHQRLSTNRFPIVGFDKQSLNIMTGEVFENSFPQGDVFLMYNPSPNRVERFYNAQGEPLDVESLKTSSKGVTVFGEYGAYGFLDSRTGDTIVPPRRLQANIPFFVYDRMIFSDLSDKQHANILVGASGEVVIGPEKELSFISFASPQFVIVCSKEYKWGLYSTSGKELLPARYNMVLPYGDDCYCAISDEEQGLFIGKIGKYLSGYRYVSRAKDGMCQVSKTVADGSLYGYINCQTGAVIAPQYKYAHSFSEGLAKVTKDDKTYFIDKSGRTVLAESSVLEFRADEFSEGVLSVRWNGKYGYIYNPVQKSNYVYNQKVFSDATVDEWFAAGDREFDKKRYATAKEYFYKVMMAQPMNIAAITNYGACLANLGHIEEALEVYSIASDIDPGDKTVLSNVAACKRELQRRETEQQQQQQRGSFWSSLYMFCSIVYDSYGAGSGSGGYGAGGDVPSGQSCSYYQSRYNELKAKLGNTGSGNAQRSGTAAGKNAAHSIAPRHASAATSGDYKVINSGRALAREYERQMQSIQRQAQQAGCSVY
ncbi:WG repeat-containing protein [uncultured Alistipes sp.]|uniref:WG repeat-containing protein n=1 Tax=uncultured Alistipes sp. TaxID=538949 RepID=UPI0025FD27E3|nr:WG repeat-containing protein [uncultured Alistipes sp.]